jgi:hypothetical protein
LGDPVSDQKQPVAVSKIEKQCTTPLQIPHGSRSFTRRTVFRLVSEVVSKVFPSVARPLWRYFPDFLEFLLMYCFQGFLISGFK